MSYFDSNFTDTLQWHHNERDGVSNYKPHDCLPNGLFRRRSKKTSKLRVTGLCARNLPVTGEFPAQMASNAENVSNWWRYHDLYQRVQQGISQHWFIWWIGAQKATRHNVNQWWSSLLTGMYVRFLYYRRFKCGNSKHILVIDISFFSRAITLR